MSYDLLDFTESLERVTLPSEPVRCVAAWGRNGDCAEWEGGFLLELADGRAAYLTGWCDTTGWGCQDGASVEVYDSAADARSAMLAPPNEWSEAPKVDEMDEDPGDINRWLAARERGQGGGGE